MWMWEELFKLSRIIYTFEVLQLIYGGKNIKEVHLKGLLNLII